MSFVAPFDKALLDGLATNPVLVAAVLLLLLLGNLGDIGLALRFVYICAIKPFVRGLLRRRPLTPVQAAALVATPFWHTATVSLRDIDLMGHMNNARYPREADFARHELLVQTGLFRQAWARRMPFVTAAQSIRYRKELKFRQTYQIRTDIVGWDGDNLIFQQVFLTERKHANPHHNRHHSTKEAHSAPASTPDSSSAPAVPAGNTVDDKYHVHCIMFVKAAVAAPRHRKEKLAAEGGGLFHLFGVLGWRALAPNVFGATRRPPDDCRHWLSTLHDSHKRIGEDVWR